MKLFNQTAFIVTYFLLSGIKASDKQPPAYENIDPNLYILDGEKCKNGTLFVTDLEGHMEYAARLFNHFRKELKAIKYQKYKGNNLTDDKFEDDNRHLKDHFEYLELSEDWCIVFGGDMVDKGPASRKLVRMAVSMKLRQPDRVLLLGGNRDYNKLRLICEYNHLDATVDGKKVRGTIFDEDFSPLFKKMPLTNLKDFITLAEVYVKQDGLPSDDPVKNFMDSYQKRTEEYQNQKAQQNADEEKLTAAYNDSNLKDFKALEPNKVIDVIRVYGGPTMGLNLQDRITESTEMVKSSGTLFAAIEVGLKSDVNFKIHKSLLFDFSSGDTFSFDPSDEYFISDYLWLSQPVGAVKMKSKDQNGKNQYVLYAHGSIDDNNFLTDFRLMDPFAGAINLDEDLCTQEGRPSESISNPEIILENWILDQAKEIHKILIKVHENYDNPKELGCANLKDPAFKNGPKRLETIYSKITDLAIGEGQHDAIYKSDYKDWVVTARTHTAATEFPKVFLNQNPNDKRGQVGELVVGAFFGHTPMVPLSFPVLVDPQSKKFIVASDVSARRYDDYYDVAYYVPDQRKVIIEGRLPTSSSANSTEMVAAKVDKVFVVYGLDEKLYYHLDSSKTKEGFGFRLNVKEQAHQQFGNRHLTGYHASANPNIAYYHGRAASTIAGARDENNPEAVNLVLYRRGSVKDVDVIEEPPSPLAGYFNRYFLKPLPDVPSFGDESQPEFTD